jgi:DNA-binding winged helix-turn-helix (wHTH) protein
MSQQRPNPIYESGQWRLDLGRRELLACGVPVPIGARALEVMEVLVRSPNELVTKDTLMARIWPGAMIGRTRFRCIYRRSAKHLVGTGRC